MGLRLAVVDEETESKRLACWRTRGEEQDVVKGQNHWGTADRTSQLSGAQHWARVGFNKTTHGRPASPPCYIRSAEVTAAGASPAGPGTGNKLGDPSRRAPSWRPRFIEIVAGRGPCPGRSSAAPRPLEILELVDSEDGQPPNSHRREPGRSKKGLRQRGRDRHRDGPHEAVFICPRCPRSLSHHPAPQSHHLLFQSLFTAVFQLPVLLFVVFVCIAISLRDTLLQPFLSPTHTNPPTPP